MAALPAGAVTTTELQTVGSATTVEADVAVSSAVVETGIAASAVSGEPVAIPIAEQGQDWEHLKWLASRDQQVCARAKCLHATREEKKFLASIHSNIAAFKQASETCIVATENDTNWFTLDVQDCFARKIRTLEQVLALLQEEDAPPVPQGVQPADVVRAPIYAGYARTADGTAKVAAAVVATQQAQRAISEVRSMWSRLRPPPPTNEGVELEATGSSAAAAQAAQGADRDADEYQPSAGSYVPPALLLPATTVSAPAPASSDAAPVFTGSCLPAPEATPSVATSPVASPSVATPPVATSPAAAAPAVETELPVVISAPPQAAPVEAQPELKTAIEAELPVVTAPPQAATVEVQTELKTPSVAAAQAMQTELPVVTATPPKAPTTEAQSELKTPPAAAAPAMQPELPVVTATPPQEATAETQPELGNKNPVNKNLVNKNPANKNPTNKNPT